MFDALAPLLDSPTAPWVALAGTLVMFAVFAATVWSLVAQGRPSGRFAPAREQEAHAPMRLRAGVSHGEEGINRFLLPQAKHERWQVQRLLHRAGFDGVGALRTFYLLRVALAAVGLIVGLVMGGLLLPSGGAGLFGGPLSRLLVVVLLGVVCGFYGPLLFVRWRAAARQELIRRSFPDALDLLQVMIQAGLGLDAALQRVGSEMHRACPPLAHELNLLVLELRAGKTREQALQDFSTRIDIDYVRAFTTVLNQSLRFGSSVSRALEVFAADMRNARMMAAEEKANKLPVQMSVVLVLFMLPAVMAVALGPVIIRAIRVIFPTLG